MLVYAYARGGVTESGIVAAAMLVPAALLAPVVASLGERRAPGHTLLAGYAAEASTCLAVAAALHFESPPVVAYALLAAYSVAFTTTRPAQTAFAPSLARRPEELTATNVVSGWIESLSMLVAPAAAGILLAAGSPALVFAVMGAAAAAGAVLVAPLRDTVPRPEPDEVARPDTGVRGGIAFVRRDENARLLVALLAAEAVALGALDVLYVELAQGVHHRGGDWAGYLGAAFGAGGVLAMSATARLVGLERLARPLVLSLAVWSLAFMGLAAVPGLAAALLLLGLGGGARTTLDVTGRTLLQRVVPPDALARVFGLLEGIQMAGLGVGSLLVPVLVAVGGASTALVAVGGFLPLAAVLASRRLLDIDRHATIPVVEISLLRSIPLFAPLAPPTLESAARALVAQAYAAGTDVIRQGDVGDRFYVIADGRVDVIADGQYVESHGRGRYFGEIALLDDVPRTATVRTCTETLLYSLEREQFLTIVTGHLRSRERARELADVRLDRLSRLSESRAPASTP